MLQRRAAALQGTRALLRVQIKSCPIPSLLLTSPSSAEETDATMEKRSCFFLKSYQSHSPTGTNNHRAARGAARRLRAASVLPGDSEFTLERKLLKLLVYIYPTHDRTRFKFRKPVRRSPTVGGKVRLRLSAQTRWSLFSGWIKSFYSSSC